MSKGDQFMWRVHIEIKPRGGITAVSILMYASKDRDNAFEYLTTRVHLITKRRKVFIKQLGSKVRYYLHDWHEPEASESEPIPEQVIALPPPATPQQTPMWVDETSTIKSVWRQAPPVKRRL